MEFSQSDSDASIDSRQKKKPHTNNNPSSSAAADKANSSSHSNNKPQGPIPILDKPQSKGSPEQSHTKHHHQVSSIAYMISYSIIYCIALLLMLM